MIERRWVGGGVGQRSRIKKKWFKKKKKMGEKQGAKRLEIN